MAAPNYKKNPGRVRMLDGKKVMPVLYNGRALGHGKYFAGAINEIMILDEQKKPVPYNKIGELV